MDMGSVKMKTSLNILGALLLVLLGTGSMLIVDKVSAQNQTPDGGVELCQVLIAPAKSDKEGSPILGANCATVSTEMTSRDAVNSPFLISDTIEPSVVASGPYILAKLWDQTNWSGNVKEIWSMTDCDEADRFIINTLSSIGWDDNTASAAVYSSCTDSYHYQFTYLNGPYVRTGYAEPTFGSLNWQTSSFVVDDY
jgi:hypothetical protein